MAEFACFGRWLRKMSPFSGPCVDGEAGGAGLKLQNHNRRYQGAIRAGSDVAEEDPLRAMAGQSALFRQWPTFQWSRSRSCER